MEICEKLIFNSVLSDKSVEIQEKYLEIKHKVNRVPSTNPIGYIGTPNTDIVPCTLRFGMKETGSIFSSFARMGTPGASDVFVGTADSGASRIEYFCNEMQTMQRQAGSIISVKLATSTGNQSSNITGVKIGWWREDGANWDLVAYSEDISTQVKAAANNSIVDITFVTPVAGVAEYDRLSIVIETSALVTDVFRTCKGLHTVASSYTTTGAEVTADKDWSSETVSTEFVPIVCSMQAPQIISIGDSLTVGFPLNNNGIHPVETASTTFEVTDPTTNIVKLVADNYSWTYQNLGDPGDATGELIRRYIWHIGDIKPRACIIWIGANDLSGGGETEENYFNRIYELINFCNSEKVIPILMNIHPAASSWFTDSRSATRREFNDIIATLGTELGAIVIDTATVVAVIRLSTGELDDIDPVYAQDTVHYNPTGCAAIASAIISEIDSL
jgi:lysophospholipase L1-like esterase